MGGRAVSTLGSHAASVKRTVANYARIRKNPTLPVRGHMPLADHLGMGIAVEMLFNLLMAKPQLKGKTHIQFDTKQPPRASYTLTWESSPMGIREGSTFAMGSMKVTVTSCPTQQKCLVYFSGEQRIGWATSPNVTNTFARV
jgi:hypothetical protein